MKNKEKYSEELFELLFLANGCEFMQTKVLKHNCGNLECMECRAKFKEWLDEEYMEAKKMELKDTIKLMESDDYKKRFAAEYYQTKIRYEKLEEFIVKNIAGVLDFEPKSPNSLYKEQLKLMGDYLRCLEARALLEGIEL